MSGVWAPKCWLNPACTPFTRTLPHVPTLGPGIGTNEKQKEAMWLRAVTFPLAAAAVVPCLVSAAAAAISAPSLKKAGDEFAVVLGVARREVYFQMQRQSQATTCTPPTTFPSSYCSLSPRSCPHFPSWWNSLLETRRATQAHRDLDSLPHCFFFCCCAKWLEGRCEAAGELPFARNLPLTPVLSSLTDTVFCPCSTSSSQRNGTGGEGDRGRDWKLCKVEISQAKSVRKSGRGARPLQNLLSLWKLCH